MKKLFTLCFALFGLLSLNAQDTFSDDFEGFTVGDYISSGSSNWTTWSGTTGTAEDAQVTDDQAASGNNSIMFAGTPTGGPQDVILDFGGLKTSGQFNFSANFYMAANNGGYFNFQGAAGKLLESPIGWRMCRNFCKYRYQCGSFFGSFSYQQYSQLLCG